MDFEPNAQFQSDSSIEKFVNRLNLIYRNKIDQYIIYPRGRWCVSVFLIILYIIRVIDIGGFYVVSYILGLYVLHMFV